MPVMHSKALKPVLYFAFLLTGVATVMMPTLLPTAVVQWSITDAQAGNLFVAQFSAGFLGSLLYGGIVSRLGQTWTVIAGAGVIALGVAAVGFTHWPVPLVFLAFYGLGLGFTLPAINLLVADASPGRRSPALNLLNFFWTLGAVTTPLAFGFLLKSRGASLSSVLGGLAALFLASGIGVWLLPSVRFAESHPVAQRDVPRSSTVTWVLTGLLLFFYVGAETAIPSWGPLMALRSHIISEKSVFLAQSCFWAALLAGRLAAGFLWKSVSPRRLTSLSLATATAGIILLSLCNSKAALLAGIVLAGAGLAAVFPTTVAMFSSEATTSGKRVAGAVFAAAGLGGAALPPFIGWLSYRGYSLRVGMALIAFVTLLMLVIEQIIVFGRQIAVLEKNIPRSIASSAD
jgi:FHS family glucose/mannose:H+ symporter-like MFS transporter